MVDRDFTTEYVLSLISSDGRRVEGLLRLDEEHESLTLQYPGGRLEAVDEDFFESFCRIREKLEAEGIRPSCYGASRNVYPSAMSRDMGGGLQAYKLTVGQPGRIADLVDIFSTGPDVVPVPVAEQRDFYYRWLESIRRR